MGKKLISLFLVLMLVFALAACNPAPAADPTPTPGGTEATPTPEPVTSPDDGGDDGAGDGDAIPGLNTNEIYKLDYYMYSIKSSDQASVVASAINELIRDKIYAEVEFVMITRADWENKALVPLRAGEKIDIFWTPEWMYYTTNINNGSLMKLNDPEGPYGDLINTYAPKTVEELGAFVPANIVDGYLYGVSTYKELCVPGGLMWNLDYVEKYGVDVTQVNTPEELTAWLEKFDEPGIYPLLTNGAYSFADKFIQGFMNNMEPISMYIGEPGARDGELISFWEDESTVARLKQNEAWYKAGYMHPDSYLKTYNHTDIQNAGQFFVTTNHVLKGGQVKAKELEGSAGNANLRLVEHQTSASVNVTTHAGGSMLGIPISSKDPVKAMLYINEMHQNVDLLNTMAWGIEGVHYDVSEDGRAIAKEMNGWSDSHGGMWTLGNQFKQMLSVKEDPDKYQQMQELTDEAWNHESLGFRFNQEGFENEYAAIYNLHDAYNQQLKCGVNLEDDYQSYVDGLYAAGLQKVMDAAKEQYTAWRTATYGQ